MEDDTQAELQKTKLKKVCSYTHSRNFSFVEQLIVSIQERPVLNRSPQVLPCRCKKRINEPRRVIDRSRR